MFRFKMIATTNHRLPLVPLDTSLPASTASATYRHLLGLALANEEPPDRIEIATLPTTMLRLSPAAIAKIDEQASRHGLSFKEAFAGLCAAGLRLYAGQRAHELARQASPPTLPFEPKSENQALFYRHVTTALLDQKIVLAEASTGIGKSRVLCAAAIQMAQLGRTPVVIAAPTVAVMEHLYAEMQALAPAPIVCTIVPGSTEFVDDAVLRDYIIAADNDDALEVDPAVRAWAAAGAKPLDPSRPLAHAIGADAAWLMDDLRALASNMPIDEFRLRSDSDSTGHAYALLQSLRTVAHETAQIVFCTHHMLAIGQMTQWSVLPRPKVVLVDEAHLFETNVAGVNSASLSMLTLRASLTNHQRATGSGAGSVVATARKLAKEITESLRALDVNSGAITLSPCPPALQPAATALARQLSLLSVKLASKALNDAPRITFYRGAIKAITTALSHPTNSGHRVDLLHSPDRRYPSLSHGPSTVAQQLRAIWNAADGGVALASATLYTTDPFGNSKCDYVRYLLNVPYDRLSTPPPVIDSHIYTLPALYAPNATAAARLAPPSKPTSNVDAAWHEAVATQLMHVLHTAVGGTLALFTAYKDIAAVARLLADKGLPAIRIVAQRPDQKFAAAASHFRELHASGERPVLLGLGVAWTGIDFQDKATDAGNDTLLTDLVIVRIPIGLNRSPSMLTRIERAGMQPLIHEALLTLKQGLGRLIRRDGVMHRRIWLLDSRPFMAVNWPGMGTLTASIRRMLRKYKTHVQFD